MTLDSVGFPLVLGLDTFGDVTHDDDDLPLSHAQTIRNVVEQGVLAETGPQGALYVGSPETVAQKIAANLTGLGATRFDLKYGMGGLSHEALMTNIELYGTPRVRDLLRAINDRSRS